MTLKEAINNFIFDKDIETLADLYKKNSYFKFKFEILNKLNQGLLNDKNIDEIDLPSDFYERIDKIKFKSPEDKSKDTYCPNYKLFKLAELIEENDITNDVEEKYEDLKEHYKDVIKDEYNDEDFDKDIITLNYEDCEDLLNEIKTKTKKLKKNLDGKNKSARVKLNLLQRHLDNVNFRNIIFEQDKLKELRNIIG